MTPTRRIGAEAPTSTDPQGTISTEPRTGGRRRRSASADYVDPEAWARLLEVWRHETKLTNAEIATRAGVDVRAVQKWLAQEVNATPGSVRDVARALGFSPVLALAEVGFLSRGEAGMAGPALDEDVAELNGLLRSPLPPKWLDILRRGVRQQMQNFLDMYRLAPAPIEPSAAQRRQGAQIQEPRRG